MTQKYQVKVSMKQAAIVETGIVLKQGDFGMQIEIEVLDFDATGTTPQIVFRKAMGAVESTTITVSSNKYTYTFKGTELDTPGKVLCDLKLKNSTTQRISTASFMFKVVADTLDGLEEESSSYSDTLEQILGTVPSAKDVPGGCTDLNQITTMGYYTISYNNSYANDPLGPQTRRTLIVLAKPDTSVVGQIILERDTGAVYFRAFMNGTTWTAWTSKLDTEVNRIENEIETTTPSAKKPDSSYTDLDQFTVMGMYTIAYNDTYAHDPIGPQARRTLIVLTSVNNNTPEVVGQIILERDTGKVYFRAYVTSDSVWSDWVSYSISGIDSLKTSVANNEAAQDGVNKTAFFNLIDKFKRMPNTRFTTDGAMGPPASGNYSAFLLTVDRNRSQNLVRIRTSQGWYRANFFDENMQQLSLAAYNWASDIPSACYYIGITYSDDITDYDTLMAAYTSETSGASSDKWSDLFPDAGYVPYRLTDYNKVYSLSENKYLPEIISEIEKQNELINENFEVEFNIYDGTYYRGKAVGEAEAATRGYYHVNNANYDCTGLMKVDNTKGTRIRTSIHAYRIATYDENLNHIRSEYTRSEREPAEDAYPKAISIANASYVAITFYSNQEVDFSTLMVAYTNENSGLYEKTWADVFPNITYSPYKLVPIIRPEIPTEQKIMEKLGSQGAIVTLDSNSGYTAEITGTDETVRDWGQLDFKVLPLQVVVVEFYGKKTGEGDGGGIIVEFYKKSGSSEARVGEKYNGFVLGESELGYHRYGYIAPKEVAFARFRMFTYASTNLTINSLKINILNCYPQREQAGILYDGHLGAIMTAPRNTMAALELGKIAGYNTMIVNVRPTSDNVLVCVHDATIDATSDGTGYVNSFTYEQLLAYDFGSWFDTIYTGTKVLKFEDAAKFISASGMGLAVSIHGGALSSANITELCRIYKKYALNGKSFIKSFDFQVLLDCYAILGDSVEYMYTGITTTAGIDLVAGFAGKCIAEFNTGALTQELANYALTNNVPISVFFGNDMREVKDFIGMGATRFCVDTFPDNVFPVV